MKRNIKITIEYDGSAYCGWQRQKDHPTIQGWIEDCIFKLTGEHATIRGSGRTDSGVHAYGQIANFHTSSKIPAMSFAKALNTYLPEDIAIVGSEEVATDFHAQYCAVAKLYYYRIISRTTRPALDIRYAHWESRSLNVEQMKKAANYLSGTHDFSSFESANSPRKSNVRTVNYIDISQKSCYIEVLIEANGFLYRMVRNIVGTLILVGRGQLEQAAVLDILNAKDRTLAGPTAPAKGLFLKRVVY